jgi:hypothetical protein
MRKILDHLDFIALMAVVVLYLIRDQGYIVISAETAALLGGLYAGGRGVLHRIREGKREGDTRVSAPVEDANHTPRDGTTPGGNSGR